MGKDRETETTMVEIINIIIREGQTITTTTILEIDCTTNFKLIVRLADDVAKLEQKVKEQGEVIAKLIAQVSHGEPNIEAPK